PSPGPRCALAAPFRPYPSPSKPEPGRYPFCGTIPDPLSPKGYSEPPGVTRHRGSMEPGLSSPRLRRPRPPNPLARREIGERDRGFESGTNVPFGWKTGASGGDIERLRRKIY